MPVTRTRLQVVGFGFYLAAIFIGTSMEAVSKVLGY